MPELEQAFDLEDVASDLPETFKHEWHKLLAGKFMHLEQYERAAASWKKAAQHASGSLQELMEEHARRAVYYEKAGRL